MESRKEIALQLFHDGYNCSQAVFGAYCDLYDIDRKTALKLSSSFGGGVGRMREMCGAVSGMLMIAGLETGSIDGKDNEQKKRNYDAVQLLASNFKERYGSIICRELLGLSKDSDICQTTPQERTEEFYKNRPCECLVKGAVDILETVLLNENGVS